MAKLRNFIKITLPEFAPHTKCFLLEIGTVGTAAGFFSGLKRIVGYEGFRVQATKIYSTTPINC